MNETIQSVVDAVRQFLELGWPGIVLIMVIVLYRRAEARAEQIFNYQVGQLTAMQVNLRECHAALSDTVEAQQRIMGELVTQVANVAALERANRDDILTIRNVVTDPKG